MSDDEQQVECETCGSCLDRDGNCDHPKCISNQPNVHTTDEGGNTHQTGPAVADKPCFIYARNIVEINKMMYPEKPEKYNLVVLRDAGMTLIPQSDVVGNATIKLIELQKEFPEQMMYHQYAFTMEATKIKETDRRFWWVCCLSESYVNGQPDKGRMEKFEFVHYSEDM